MHTGKNFIRCARDFLDLSADIHSSRSASDVLAAGAVVARTDVAGVSGVSGIFVCVGAGVGAGVFITTDNAGFVVNRSVVV